MGGITRDAKRMNGVIDDREREIQATGKRRQDAADAEQRAALLSQAEQSLSQGDISGARSQLSRYLARIIHEPVGLLRIL